MTRAPDSRTSSVACSAASAGLIGVRRPTASAASSAVIISAQLTERIATASRRCTPRPANTVAPRWTSAASSANVRVDGRSQRSASGRQEIAGRCGHGGADERASNVWRSAQSAPGRHRPRTAAETSSLTRAATTTNSAMTSSTAARRRGSSRPSVRASRPPRHRWSEPWRAQECSSASPRARDRREDLERPDGAELGKSAAQRMGPRPSRRLRRADGAGDEEDRREHAGDRECGVHAFVLLCVVGPRHAVGCARSLVLDEESGPGLFSGEPRPAIGPRVGGSTSSARRLVGEPLGDAAAQEPVHRLDLWPPRRAPTSRSAELAAVIGAHAASTSRPPSAEPAARPHPVSTSPRRPTRRGPRSGARRVARRRVYVSDSHYRVIEHPASVTPP